MKEPEKNKQKKNRVPGDFLNFLVTCVVLFITITISNGSFTSRISEISETLDKAIFDVLDMKDVNYTDFNDNITYYSNTQFNPRGMGGLYNLTEKFMNLLISKDIIPPDILKVSNGIVTIEPIDEHWKELLTFYSGLLVIVLILLLFTIFLPLCGFCFCCCRCCGNCGARSKPFDKKHDLYKKFLLATLLISLGTLMLFGVVCAFVSNQHMEDGENELVGNLNINLRDAKTYLSVTQAQIDVVFVKNFNEFKEFIFDILGKTSDIVYDRLTEFAKAISVTQIKNIVDGLKDIQSDLEYLKNSTNSLQVNASQLNDALRKVKRDLLKALNDCNRMYSCSSIVNDYVSKLGSDIDFDSLPDISKEMDALTSVIDGGIEKSVQAGYDSLIKIKADIDIAVQQQLNQVRVTISSAGEQIEHGASNVTDVLNSVQKSLDDANIKLNQFDDYVKQYGPYRYYVGLAVSCILLLITFCIALGLICGVCGKRPDGYSDDCCNKGAGSRFLMCAVLIMFLFGIVLAIVTLVYFIIGVSTQGVVCHMLRNPDNNRVIDIANGLFVHHSNLSKDVNISSIINSCNKNESIYGTLKLKDKFDVEDVNEYIEKYNISQALTNLEDNIKVNMGNITILNNETKGELTKLSQSGLSNISFGSFKSVMDYNFTTVNLNYLADELEKLINTLNDDVKDAIKNDLLLSALHLRTYQSQLVDPMSMSAMQMIRIAKNLEEGLKFNSSSFENAITTLIKEVQDTQDYLQNKGAPDLIMIAKNFSTSIEGHVRTYLNRVVNGTVNHIGQCGPVTLVLNSTLTSTCEKILLPLNGFWFGIFWSLILFVPTIIVSVKLASLYQKLNPYSRGHLIETEYLYDAYTDRDSIPLNSADYSNDKFNKKKYKKKNKCYDDRIVPGPGGDVGVPDYSGGSNQNERYADMAPKHWEEFPSGGPPQYHRAPTEYERPPPYYYPGTGEHQ